MSMYQSPFFRDGSYTLLLDQRPEDVDLLRNPRGERMHPGEATGILPAGTNVRITEIQFATASNVSSRSIMTPRFFTWVIVDVPGEERDHVIVIRDEPDSHERFEYFLDRFLTTDDVAGSLASYPEPVRTAIKEKRLVEGMDVDAVRMAWGNPLQVTRDFDKGIQLDVWMFEGDKRRASFRDEKLISWSEDPSD